MNINIDGTNICYEVSGEGSPVLLLHGWGADISSFKPLIDFLKEKRRVFALDFPGFGKSDHPETAWDVGDYTTFLINFLKRVDLTKTDIIAHSFGGRVAIKLAIAKPEIIDKLILVDSSGIKPRRTIKYYFKVIIAKTGKAAGRTLGNPGNNLKKRVYKYIGSKDFKDAGPMKDTLIKVINENLRPLLKKIKAPTLLIWGENDNDTPVYMGRIMEKEIKNAGLVVLKNAGHYSYLDQFQQFCAIINSFLSNNKCNYSGR